MISANVYVHFVGLRATRGVAGSLRAGHRLVMLPWKGKTKI